MELFAVLFANILGMFVLISGFVGPEELRDSRSSKVDRFLTKPFLSSDLVACVEAVTPAYCPR